MKNPKRSSPLIATSRPQTFSNMSGLDVKVKSRFGPSTAHGTWLFATVKDGKLQFGQEVFFRLDSNFAPPRFEFLLFSIRDLDRASASTISRTLFRTTTARTVCWRCEWKLQMTWRTRIKRDMCGFIGKDRSARRWRRSRRTSWRNQRWICWNQTTVSWRRQAKPNSTKRSFWNGKNKKICLVVGIYFEFVLSLSWGELRSFDCVAKFYFSFRLAPGTGSHVIM